MWWFIVIVGLYLLFGLAFASLLNSKSGINSKKVFDQQEFRVDGWFVILVAMFWPYYFWIDYKYGQDIRWGRKMVT